MRPVIEPITAVSVVAPSAVMLCKAKRQYLLTCEESRYCLLALHGGMQSFLRGLRLSLLAIAAVTDHVPSKHEPLNRYRLHSLARIQSSYFVLSADQINVIGK